MLLLTHTASERGGGEGSQKDTLYEGEMAVGAATTAKEGPAVKANGDAELINKNDEVDTSIYLYKGHTSAMRLTCFYFFVFCTNDKEISCKQCASISWSSARMIKKYAPTDGERSELCRQTE